MQILKDLPLNTSHLHVSAKPHKDNFYHVCYVLEGSKTKHPLDKAKTHSEALELAIMYFSKL